MFPWERLLTVLLDKGEARQEEESPVLRGAAHRLPHFTELVEFALRHNAAHSTSSTARTCSGELCCGSLAPPGTGLCTLYCLYSEDHKWSKRGDPREALKWELENGGPLVCCTAAVRSWSVTRHNASKALMSPYKNMNWLLKIVHNWTLRNICFLSDNTFPVITLKYVFWQ